MVVLHYLIHSSRVHQDFVGGVQLSFLLESRSANNSSFSSEVVFAFLRSSQVFRHWLWCNFTSSFELFLISPQQAYSFVVVFPQQLRSNLLLRMLSNSFMVEVVVLSSIHFIPLFQFFRRHCVVHLVKCHPVL